MVMAWQEVIFSAIDSLVVSSYSPDMIMFFLVLLAALVFPMLLRGLNVPWVVALIVAGMVIGPSGVDLVSDSPVLSFLSDIGVVFLMFMAGLETGFSRLKSLGRESLTIGAVNGIVPFIAGFLIISFFGYDWQTAVIVGAAFMSSSVAVVLPTLESRNMLDSEIGGVVISSTMLQDVSSLIVLGALMNEITGSSLPTHYFLLLLFTSLAALKLVIPKIKEFLEYENRKIQGKGFETEVRMIVVLMIGIVALYELVGLHPIVSGFVAGLFLSDLIENEEIINKIHGLGYGIFIPLFFVEVGTTFELGAMSNLAAAGTLAVSVILGTVTTKYLSGYVASRLNGYSPSEASIISSTSLPQLSTALAVAYLGLESGILDTDLMASVLLLSVTTTALSPVLIRWTLRWGEVDSDKM